MQSSPAVAPPGPHLALAEAPHVPWLPGASELAELEESLADVLERAALEAGVDLA